MANTRKAAKRAGQAIKRQERNTIIKSATRSALKKAIDSLKSTDKATIQAAYKGAVRAVAKAASKGSIPKARAARKIGRLTRLIQKTKPGTIGASK